MCSVCAAYVTNLTAYVTNLSSQVKKIIAAGEHDKLLMYDQLLEEQQTGHAFIGFHEGPITFPPSYKFDPGIAHLWF